MDLAGKRINQPVKRHRRLRAGCAAEYAHRKNQRLNAPTAPSYSMHRESPFAF
jgi:hypothetical protein